jgi:dynein light chain roadblock-type
MSQKVEETLNRINTHMGVLGVIIVNQKGVAIRSTMDQNATIEYGSLIT